jgi:hypothetical protein
MPRFHFHTSGVKDDDGHILPSLEVAKCEAVKLAGRIICDDAESFWGQGEWAMTVSDEVGLTLFYLQIVGTESPAIEGASSRRSARRSASA